MSPDRIHHIEQQLAGFETIPLDQLESSGLFQNRIDRKYVLPADKLEDLLHFFREHYRVLEVNGKRCFSYQTRYFDTRDFDFYFQHHRDKPSRVKVRERTYLESGLQFVEVKQKEANGHTRKFRTAQQTLEGSGTFIESHAGYPAESLSCTLQSRYQRITLFHKTELEKVTIDLGLNYATDTDEQGFPNILLLEIKTPGRTSGKLINWLKEQGIREGSLSKYILGLISLHPELKHNRFKKAYTNILNKNNHGPDHA